MGSGRFGPDPFGSPIGGPDLFGGPELAGYEDLSTMESFEPIFFFDDPSLYNDFLEPPLELEENLGSSSSNAGQTLTGDSGSNVINGTDGDDTIDGGLGVDTLTGVMEVIFLFYLILVIQLLISLHQIL